MRKLAACAEGTAGSVMTPDHATVPPALTTVRPWSTCAGVAPDAETIDHSYVGDDERRLVGTVNLRDLIVARDGATIESIMRHDPPFIHAEGKRDEAVKHICKYDLPAVPVIKDGDRLAGIVTCDDAMDVAREAEDVSFVKTLAEVGLLGLTMALAGRASAFSAQRWKSWWWCRSPWW